MATTIRAHIYARGEVSFAKFLFLPIWFDKLLEANFSCFVKIISMPSWFAKPLELLLVVTREQVTHHPMLHQSRVDVTCTRSVTQNPRCIRSSRSCASPALAGLRTARWGMRHLLGRARNLQPSTRYTPSHTASGRVDVICTHSSTQYARCI
jgi:hypothetical protein